MIPQIQPWIDDSEWQEVKRVMDSTYLTENKVTEQFESSLKAVTGRNTQLQSSMVRWLYTASLRLCILDMGMR